MFDSAAYWEARYASGGSSGPGSDGEAAQSKASFVNKIVKRHGIHSVIEFGCGDGRQLELAEYPEYWGIDVSPTAIQKCQKLFHDDDSKTFICCEPSEFTMPFADLALSMDVIYHLIEDDVFDRYMTALFAAAGKMVVTYARSKPVEDPAEHVLYRDYLTWVKENAPGWMLQSGWLAAASSGLEDFYVFQSGVVLTG